MKNFNIKRTKEIEKKYNITRQTINNWIKQGLLEKPKKDFRNWFIWTLKDEANIIKILENKIYNNNQTKKKLSPMDYLKISNRRYLGSKQKLLHFIEEIVDKHTSGVNSVADIFGGTGVVADLFRKKGKSIIINDILHSNVITYETWFGNEKIDINKINKLISELNSIVASNNNYVSINFGDKYFSMENARKIGVIREKIESYNINCREKSFLLTSLLYAMDKVANTVGHYDAFRKKMDSFQPLELKVPENNINTCNKIYCEDANLLVKKIVADLVYIDTPYNSRQYGDAYHLLENIIDWKKPKLEGIARKMTDRNNIKSIYSTQKAPEAFDDLIQNINAKYILVSYNNMAKKGNGRSNAKISNEEIISSLKKRGEVQVFETPFKVFTTGKTNIEDHKELLYLCTINDMKKDIKKEYIQSPINYSGGKYKLLHQILPLFPKHINIFYDIFAGGGNVALNVNAKYKILNDIEPHIISLYKYIQNKDINFILKMINQIIKKYNLSETGINGYNYYNIDSSNGLKSINEIPYKKLRDDYNSGLFDNTEYKDLVFYVLIVFSFNNQIRFNNNGKYNMPPGKRDFNKKMEKKLCNFKKAISYKTYKFINFDFREVLSKINNTDDFVYLDPPYLISNASYNENGGWNEHDEKELLFQLDILDRKGIKFALSNVIFHKNSENTILKEWAKKYKIHFLNFNYNNSNYQSLAKNHKTVEVLITNY